MRRELLWLFFTPQPYAWCVCVFLLCLSCHLWTFEWYLESILQLEAITKQQSASHNFELFAFRLHILSVIVEIGVFLLSEMYVVEKGVCTA
jgi:hypothetical protein